MMKKLFSLFLLFSLVLSQSVASASPTDIGLERLWNSIYDSSDESIQVDLIGNGALNVVYVGIDDDIEAAVAAATAGDTLILAAGTYTIIDDIDIGKAINIVGQGIGQTTIVCATGSKNMFDVAVTGVRIANLSMTSSGASNIAIKAVGASIVVENVDIVMTGNTLQNALSYLNAGGEVRNVTISTVSGTGTAQAVQIQNTTSTDYILNCYNVCITGSGTTGSNFGFQNYDNGGTGDSTLNIYNSSATITSSGGTSYGSWVAGGTDAFTNVYNSTLNSTTADVIQADGSSLTIYDTTLVNNTYSGTIVGAGTVVASIFSADGAIVSTNFKNCMEVGELTIWISDGTAAEANLVGEAGDICLNGGTAAGQTAFCDTAGTSWTDM